MRRTKIVCTIGPASSTVPMLKRLLRAGMNVARLNFSHGTYKDHAALIENIRRASKETGLPVALLQDLQGPRIRIGELAEPVTIKKGQMVLLVPEPRKMVPGTVKKMVPGTISLPQQYKKLAREVKKGTTILIADGAMSLVVERIEGDTIHARVTQGGTVKSHKGLNIPGVTLSAAAMTAKDKADLLFGLKQGVDFVTLSFVKTARDLQALRKQIANAKPKRSPRIVAKVERPEAIVNIAAIVDASDAIMLGRGDLALEADQAKLAVMQEDVIAACLRAGKPVITATQMLESMTISLRPTRAELSDVGHAVMDHTDATMLSGETAGGMYPVETVQTMAAIIEETEASKYDNIDPMSFGKPTTSEDGLAFAVAVATTQLSIATIIIMPAALTLFPNIIRLRPEAAIVPVVSDGQLAQIFALSWGTHPVVAPKRATAKQILVRLRKERRYKKGDHILVVSSIPTYPDTIDAAVTVMRG